MTWRWRECLGNVCRELCALSQGQTSDDLLLTRLAAEQLLRMLEQELPETMVLRQLRALLWHHSSLTLHYLQLREQAGDELPLTLLGGKDSCSRRLRMHLLCYRHWCRCCFRLSPFLPPGTLFSFELPAGAALPQVLACWQFQSGIAAWSLMRQGAQALNAYLAGTDCEVQTLRFLGEPLVVLLARDLVPPKIEEDASALLRMYKGERRALPDLARYIRNDAAHHQPSEEPILSSDAQHQP